MWVDNTTCLDPDECLDDDTDESGATCGFNGRGTDDRVCVAGGWVEQNTCSNDPDECVDDAVDEGGPACGLNGRGDEDRLCVTGSW